MREEEEEGMEEREDKKERRHAFREWKNTKESSGQVRENVKFPASGQSSG